MKRRNFLFGSLGVAGGFVPLIGRTQVPCPPSTVSVEGGTTAQSTCTSGDELGDWLTRASGPGVVWYHNFESAAEVDNFRFRRNFGTDKNNSGGANHMRWVADGFAGGGCAEVMIPAGGTNVCDWWRPMSPLSAPGNGRSTNDPGASGSLTRRTYDPTDQSAYAWGDGYYGRSEYHGQAQFDGTEFYLQMRVKISASRFNSGQPEGKLIYIDRGNGSDQELVIQSLRGRRFSMYTSFGSLANSQLHQPQGANISPVETITNYQPGNDGTYPATSQSNGFNWPPDEWVTMLLHVVPGLHYAPGMPAYSGGQGPLDAFKAARTAGVYNNTRIRIWIARRGAQSYTKIWDKSDYIWTYDPSPNGFNLIKCSGYMNGVPALASAGWTHRYAQVIFSKQTIPCPQA